MLNIGMKLQYIIHVETLILEVMGVRTVYWDTPLYFFQIEIVVHVNSISLSRLVGLAKSSDKFVSKNFYATACA